MSMTTPPGWYPDPGQTPHLPPQERWWNGGTWTEHTRPSAGAPPVPPSPPGGTRRGPLIAGIVCALVLVGALVVGAVLAFSGGDGDSDTKAEDGRKKSGPRDAGPTPDDPDDPQGQDPDSPGDPGDDPSAPEDGETPVLPATGVKLPVPNGWTAPEEARGTAVTIGPYDCPGAKGKDCLRGGTTVTRTLLNGSVSEVAEADVKANAESSYSEETYGGILSHKVVKKGKVTVAGQDGYRVRWKIENKVKPDAYVESVAFRHPDGSRRMLVIRSGFDIHKDAPPVSDMDKLVAGVKRGSAEDSGEREGV